MTFATKQDQVSDVIRERIIVGAYPRGTKLRQAALAEELGVSITPVREALMVLEAEGYVRGDPHKGLVVPELVPEQTREIFDLRLMLERELTSIAVAKMTPARLKDLRELNGKLNGALESGQLVAVRIANFRFHFQLYAIAERPQTLQFVRILWAKYPFTAQDVAPERPRRVQQEHELFLQKVAQDDRAGATQAMVEHIRNGWLAANPGARASSPGRGRRLPAHRQD